MARSGNWTDSKSARPRCGPPRKSVLRSWARPHPETLHVRALLLEYLAEANAVEAFDEMGPSTVATCEEVLGNDSFTTVTGRHNLAFGLYRFGRLEQAEPVARRALTDRKRLNGPEHALTASAAVLLSWILSDRGLSAESITIRRQSLFDQERALGVEHPYVLLNRTGLAETLATSGDLAEARTLARENLPLCTRVLGLTDPITLKTRGLADGPADA